MTSQIHTWATQNSAYVSTHQAPDEPAQGSPVAAKPTAKHRRSIPPPTTA